MSCIIEMSHGMLSILINIFLLSISHDIHQEGALQGAQLREVVQASLSLSIYIYIYVYVCIICMYVYIYIYIDICV